MFSSISESADLLHFALALHMSSAHGFQYSSLSKHPSNSSISTTSSRTTSCKHQLYPNLDDCNNAAMAPTLSDSDMTFLVACLKHTEGMPKPDFEKVATDVGAKNGEAA